MGLGKGKTEHAGPRDLARKSGHRGFTEEAKEWASRARRRDEDADLRRVWMEHGADAEPIDGLTELWHNRWPDCRPIGHELRGSSPDRWVRFHSLPDSKRYAESSEELAELLHRHHAIIDELRASTSSGDKLIVITASWSGTAEPSPRATEVDVAMPGEPWVSVLRETDEDGYEYWTHLFATQIHPDDAALDRLLRLVANDQTAGVIISDASLQWLYHPYDGGADVIASSAAQRDELRDAHSAWLSEHPQGL